jgi:hypothetical protein
VKYIPVFSEADAGKLQVTMISENLSAIPANVIFDKLTPWIDGRTSGTFLYSPSGDILYQHKGGFSVLPAITGELAKRLVDGQSELMIGTCVIYGSISSSDARRWEARALYSYERGSEVPATQYTQEIEIPTSQDKCESATVRQEWLRRARH